MSGKLSTDSSSTSASTLHFHDHTRVLIALIAVLCLSMVIANATLLNFTVICMRKETSEIILTSSNDSQHGQRVLVNQTDMFSAAESSWLFSAVALGAIFGTLPITRLNFAYGAR